MASTATTMHCEPKRPAASSTKAGLFTAAVLMLTLSAPALSSRRTSATVAHAPADGERNEDLRRHVLDHVHDRVARVARGGDVEESEFVGALLVVAARDLHRIARVAQAHEVHPLHHAARGDVEAGNDALGESHGRVSGEQ